jgi:hypothetical protein
MGRIGSFFLLNVVTAQLIPTHYVVTYSLHTVGEGWSLLGITVS